MPTTNAQQFEADLKAAQNGDTIKLKGNIVKDVIINKLVNLDLNGKTITGNVTINNGAKGTINLTNGTIDGDLTVDARQATVNNSLTVKGNTNINNVAVGTWNEKAIGNKLVINDPDGVTLNVAAGSSVLAITVNPEAVGTVKITNNGTIEKVDANASITLINNEGAQVDLVTGTAEVEITGEGVVGENTNTTDPKVIALKEAQDAIDTIDESNIYSEGYKTSVANANNKTNAAREAGVTDIQIGQERVAKLDAANDFLAPVLARLDGGGAFTFDGVNTFNVTADSKIGAKGTEGVHFAGQEWASSYAQGFSYTTDGAFYAISLTDKDGNAVEFATVFDTFALQTQGSANTQSYDQNSTGRKGGDFGVTGVAHKGTAIYSNDTNEAGTLYYGIHSGIAGVNYTNGAKAAINVSGTLLDGATAGDYNITVTMYAPARADKATKHANKESLTELDSVNYSFTVDAQLSNDTTLSLSAAQTNDDGWKGAYPISIKGDVLKVNNEERLYSIEEVLQAPAGGSVVVVDKDGNEMSDKKNNNVMEDWKVVVTAEDGTTKEYSIQIYNK